MAETWKKLAWSDQLPSQLSFDAQTGSFTPGNSIIGAVTGASATIIGVGSGILYLDNISGTFQDDEIIYESALGSELVTDGDCSSDSFTVGGNWVYDGTNEEYDCTAGSGANLWQDCGITQNKFYRAGYTIKNFVSGAIRSNPGSYNVSDINRIANGTYIDIVHTSDPSTNARHNIRPWSSFEGSVDDISLKQITNAALVNGTLSQASLSTVLIPKIESVSEDTTPQLGGDLDLNQKSIVLDASPTSDHTWNGEVFSGTAGENLAIFETCYLKSDGKYWKIDASAEATAAGKIVMATAAISADASGIFLQRGYVRDDSADEWDAAVALDYGAIMFLSETAGHLTDTRPETASAIVRVAGYMESSTVMWFDPDKTWIEV